jgi:hypothetical protein
MEAIDLILNGFKGTGEAGGEQRSWKRIATKKEGTNKYYAVLDGASYSITYNGFNFLRALVAEEGRPIAFESIPGLKSAKLERVMKNLPPAIAKFVKKDHGKGCWLGDEPGVS